MRFSRLLRILLLLTVGLPYLAVKGAVLLARKTWEAIVVHRGLQIVLFLLVFITSLASWKFGPLVMGRLSLLSSAETLAHSPEGRNTLDMENELRRKAFRLGFRSAITPQSVVSIERTHDGGITLCTITFVFPREVDLLGLWRLSVAVSGKVEEPVEPASEKGKSMEEILVQ